MRSVTPALIAAAVLVGRASRSWVAADTTTVDQVAKVLQCSSVPQCCKG